MSFSTGISPIDSAMSLLHLQNSDSCMPQSLDTTSANMDPSTNSSLPLTSSTSSIEDVAEAQSVEPQAEEMQHDQQVSPNKRGLLDTAAGSNVHGAKKKKTKNKSSNQSTQDQDLINSRAYQIEMFELSLKKNIIVAMPTGSGKTQIAVLRIRAEAERTPPEKISWFMTPTVALCDQQYAVLTQQMPAVPIKLLNGAVVATWSAKEIWEGYLKGARVVISTYQILYDALSHAFFTLDRISLIVFDEAHNCRGKSAGVKTMLRYHERKDAGLPVPAILGLTASPIMKSKLSGLEEIERMLDSVCKTPSIHREDLSKMVKLPQMLCSKYTALPRPLSSDLHTRSMSSLMSVSEGAESDLFKDPCVLRLAAKTNERSRAKLLQMLRKKDTYTIKQLQAFVRKSHEIRRELGPWAVDYFIGQSIHQFQAAMGDIWLNQARSTEKQYLSRWLAQIQTTPCDVEVLSFSTKVEALTRQLLACPRDAKGIVFVEQTATVVILARMLSRMPELRGRFQVGTMVGTSQFGQRARVLGELHKKSDYSYLEQFRLGALNLLIATNVLEEGIDVPACNLVVCFDPPANLKSFIQRRGRARKGVSRLILLVDEEDERARHLEWIDLEEGMKKRYEDELRDVSELMDLEESERPDIAPLRIQSSGAKLDFDEAKSHLQHLCTHLSSRKDADSTPYYLVHRTEPTMAQPSQITATVVLPSSLPADLRRFKSERVWYSDKNATKDAAFVAFKALYKAGLVNENLMPLVESLDTPVFETVPGLVEARECYNPWMEIAHAWGAKPIAPSFTREVRLLDHAGNLLHSAELTIPIYFPEIPKTRLYWDKDTAWIVEFGSIIDKGRNHEPARDQSLALLDIAYGHRFRINEIQHVVHVYMPSDPSLGVTSFNVLGDVTMQTATTAKTLDCLVRDNYHSPFFCTGWLPSMPERHAMRGSARLYAAEHSEGPWLSLKRWPRQVDFLHPSKTNISTDPSSSKRHTFRPVLVCKQDSVPIATVKLGAVLPSIFHVMELYLIAHKLSTGLLADTGLDDLSLIVTALSSSKAHGPTNYQRLEFLGDTILKFMATITLSATRLRYPEGYLTILKSNMVSNSHLCRVTLETGLDAFILTEPFAGRKWRPNYVDELLQSESTRSETRLVSTKTLADVVESLLGAAHLVGGWPSATRYLQKMMPNIDWHTPEQARAILRSQRPVSRELSSLLAPLEELCGYKFVNKTILVEAMTHTSFSAFDNPVLSGTGPETDATKHAAGYCASLERLEFLGDAALDMIVGQYLWKCKGADVEHLSHQQMHLLRTAAVNADLLGFLSMEWSIPQQRTDIASVDWPEVVSNTTDLPFWKFMRHSNPALGLKQQVAEYRHAAEGEGVRAALRTGTVYPWKELAHLQIPKTFSDLVEALLGAVWTDSGSAEQCADVAEKIGILPLLRRLVADSVDVMHPKNKLGELIKEKKLRYEPGLCSMGILSLDSSPDLAAAGSREAEVLADGDGYLPEASLLPTPADTASSPSFGLGGNRNNKSIKSDSAVETEGELHSLDQEAIAYPAAVRALLSRTDEHTCKVYVDEELVVEVEGGLSREEVITKAADAAYHVLLARAGGLGVS